MKTGKIKKRFIKHDDFIVERFKSDHQFLQECLKGAFEDYAKEGEISYLLETLRLGAEAIGISKLAEQTGLGRQNLYKILSKDGNPTIRNFDLILKALGYRLDFKALTKKKLV